MTGEDKVCVTGGNKVCVTDGNKVCMTDEDKVSMIAFGSKKALLVYNPVAGNKSFRRSLDYVIKSFQRAGTQIVPYRTEPAAAGGEDALERLFAQISERGGFQKILVAGGDGTVSRVFGMMARHQTEIPVGLFPVGTANDYAQCLGLTGDLRQAAETALADHLIRSDVGLVNGRPFINVACIGMLADLSHKTDTKAKNSLGMLAYYFKGIEELPAFAPVPVDVRWDGAGKSDGGDGVDVDASVGSRFSGEINLMLVMNGRSAGGFKKIAPAARIDDGLLDVVIFKKCPVLDLIPLLLQVNAGEHLASEHILHFQTTRLTVGCGVPCGTDLDGEAGPAFPLEIGILPGRVRVLSPAAPAAQAAPAAPAMPAAQIAQVAQIARIPNDTAKHKGEPD
ncbi:MAG: YegS/Rv2252/BmrU family lipid kinase [Clostridiales bacterium]|jgi:YegS/Rv2252/BmrU family lipid kinase|nr:YegS/Rv2252/BmrU family lipid kinase [Clostridiales bacterium]